MRDEREKFWKERSKNYEKLEWAIKGGYLHAFLDAGDFVVEDYVLDVGTGTGIIAHTISPFVEKVVGVDTSKDMLAYAFKHRSDNEDFMKMDATSLSFDDNCFSKVTARMVFHHILENTQQAMNECYRVLKPGGKMIFSEGVPPSEGVKPFYVDMFRLKEERLTFMDSDLMIFMREAGFRDIEEKVYWSRQSSIMNWLRNSGLPMERQQKIFDMHIQLDELGKKNYNMVIKDDDCFVDMKFIILTGIK